MNLLDAAEIVLEEAGESLHYQEIMQRVFYHLSNLNPEEIA